MMTSGELLTRATIWLALAGYTAGAGGQLLAQGKPHVRALARWAGTLGCLGLLAHVICAFHFYHGWSQAAAYRETARQTAAVTGLNWGGGLWINYLLLAAWTADVIWWWRSGDDAYRRRSRVLTVAWHALLLFIVFKRNRRL